MVTLRIRVAELMCVTGVPTSKFHGPSPTMHWASPCLGNALHSEIKSAALLCAQGHVLSQHPTHMPTVLTPTTTHAPFLDTHLCHRSLFWPPCHREPGESPPKPP